MVLALVCLVSKNNKNTHKIRREVAGKRNGISRGGKDKKGARVEIIKILYRTELKCHNQKHCYVSLVYSGNINK